MRIVCLQMVLMKYHTLFFSKIRKDVANFLSAAVVIGALRVKSDYMFTKQKHYVPFNIGQLH